MVLPLSGGVVHHRQQPDPPAVPAQQFGGAVDGFGVADVDTKMNRHGRRQLARDALQGL
ncbi:hypothetical protein [Mycobacterium genavense]|uniref:hypothetical protein n=1 Tax=Mycobacterium genavense TaxID=36812 RepID=UPI0012EC050D|nr:hypothetical protein [Mycobacterium genavense]